MLSVEVRFLSRSLGGSSGGRLAPSTEEKDRQGFAKCAVLIKRLAREGHGLRRPAASILRDGLHELRARRGRVHYRVVYCFHGRGTAVLLHALTKEAKVPRADMSRALRRKAAFEANPEIHTYEGTGD